MFIVNSSWGLREFILAFSPVNDDWQQSSPVTEPESVWATAERS
jgi:hypothetical protein